MTPSYAHQTRTLRAVSALYGQGAKSVLVACPTGGGKTRMGTIAMRNHLAANPDRRGVVLVHRYELVEQWNRALQLHDVGIDCCAVLMAQTAVARGTTARATFAIFDEAHHYVADEWGEVRKAYADVQTLGLSATPERSDGLGLGGAFEHLVVAAQIRELVAAGVLVPCRVVGAKEMLTGKRIAMDPVEAFFEYTPHGQAVVFAANVNASQGYQSGFVKRGLAAVHVDGKTDPEQRAAMLAGFAAESVRVICNVNVLTEGWDAPRADVCILARGCSSQGAFLQMVGRVLRAAPEKTGATLLDLAGVVNVLGPPDEDRVFSLEGRAIKRTACDEAICRQCGRLASACECGEAQDLKPPTVTGEDLVDWAERYRSVKEELNPSRTALALGGILRKAAEAHKQGKTWKEGAVVHRFRAIFRRAPDAATLAMAHRVNALSDPDYEMVVKRAQEARRRAG